MKKKIVYTLLYAMTLVVIVGVAGFVGAWVGALFAMLGGDHGKGVVIFMCLGAVIAIVAAICFLFDEGKRIGELSDDAKKNVP